MIRGIVVAAALFLLCGPSFAEDAPAAPTTPAPAGPPRAAARQPMRIVPCISSSLRVAESSRVGNLAIRLNLSEAEKAKVQNLLSKAEEELAPKIEEQRKASEAYAMLLIKENATEPELTDAAEKVAKLESEVNASKIKTLFALKAMLRPEQNKALADYMRQFSMQWLPREMQPDPGSFVRPPGTPPGPPSPPEPPAPPAPPAPPTAPSNPGAS